MFEQDSEYGPVRQDSLDSLFSHLPTQVILLKPTCVLERIPCAHRVLDSGGG